MVYTEIYYMIIHLEEIVGKGCSLSEWQIKVYVQVLIGLYTVLQNYIAQGFSVCFSKFLQGKYMHVIYAMFPSYIIPPQLVV